MAPIKFSADKTDRKEEPKTTKEKFLFSKKKRFAVLYISPLSVHLEIILRNGA
jgi:hypothetical protein